MSVATLVRVLFDHPLGGDTMLALERKATVAQASADLQVDVRAQPFGGAVQFRSLIPLQSLIGDVVFDSPRSRSENDFRILIRPEDWGLVRAFCLDRLRDPDDAALDADPARELIEEFADALAINLGPDQYRCEPVETVVEEEPTPTRNPRAAGFRTARIYRTFDVRILDPALARALLDNSERLSDEDLRDRAAESARGGGPGKANGVLVLPLARLTDGYRRQPPEARAKGLTFEWHSLEANVPAVLDGIDVPGYRRLPDR